MNRFLLFSGAAALAVLSASAPVSAEATIGQTIAGTRLDIVGTGEVSAVPDLATVGAGVVSTSPTAAGAMADNAARMASTVAALRKAGVADRDLQTTSISLSPQYRYQDNQPPVITGYQASSRVSVRFRDIRAAGKILDSLVAAGANQIDGPRLTVDKPEALFDEARQKAIRAAQARAGLYAAATGLKVKRIVSIAENGEFAPPPAPPPVYMAMARKSEAADSAIEAGEQKLSVSVAVTFELE